jgi:hypothetical protein
VRRLRLALATLAVLLVAVPPPAGAKRLRHKQTKFATKAPGRYRLRYDKSSGAYLVFDKASQVRY